MRLQDKVAIITGAGGGMGRTAALMFAAQGARVVVAEFGEAAGAETVGLVEANGGQASFIKVDVSNEADAKAMVDHAIDRPSAGSTSSTTTPGSCPRPTTR